MTKPDPRTEALGRTRLFRACSPKELSQIAALTTRVDVPAGATVCEEGTAGSEFFLVMSGTAHVSMAGKRLAEIGPGAFFGEMALIDGGPRIATVSVATDLSLLVLNRREFRTVLRIGPSAVEELLAVIGQRLRESYAVQRRPQPGPEALGPLI